jgi:hypothetical protein
MRVWILSRIVGEPHQRVTPRTILEYITAERKEKFGTEKVISKDVNSMVGYGKFYLIISLASAAEN